MTIEEMIQGLKAQGFTEAEIQAAADYLVKQETEYKAHPMSEHFAAGRSFDAAMQWNM